jgi:hypothetical protein
VLTYGTFNYSLEIVMARRFSVKVFNIAGLNVRLKFESEQLHEDGTILADTVLEETVKKLTETLTANKDLLPEVITETAFTEIGRMLVADPANVYTNLLGDEYQRTKLISMELMDNAGNSTIYED